MSPVLRWMRHAWLDAGDAQRLLSPQGLQRLQTRIIHSEEHHQGELRICVEGGLPWSWLWRGLSARERAIDLFSQLRVWDTAHNNGVLIYLLLADRRIEIVADRGLHGHVPEGTWESLIDELQGHCCAGRFEDGLNHAIDRLDALMRTHWPLPACRTLNPNELPDTIVLL